MELKTIIEKPRGYKSFIWTGDLADIRDVPLATGVKPVVVINKDGNFGVGLETNYGITIKPGDCVVVDGDTYELVEVSAAGFSGIPFNYSLDVSTLYYEIQKMQKEIKYLRDEIETLKSANQW